MESWRPENYVFSFDPDKVGAPFAAPSLILAGRQDTIVGYRVFSGGDDAANPAWSIGKGEVVSITVEAA